jgi:FAD/FMN-containing dehydrogenase
MTRSITEPDWAALRAGIAGEALLPGSAGYELARKPEIARFADARPEAVVRCATPADVAATISLARRAGLPTATRSGGHDFAGHSSTDGIVIDVSPMRSVSVQGEVATIGAGARLADVYDSLAALGRTIPAGCGPTVGIAGLTLGGGLGILGRRYGLTCDSLLAAQVVLADGRTVDCDPHRHEDLFWALRGAGALGFGVVTALTFRTVPAPATTCLHLVWPLRDAVPVMEAWQAWSPEGPDELAASLLVTAPADPERPPLVHLFGAMAGGEADTRKLLDELVARAGADPVSAATEHLPFRQAKRYLAEHGPGDERPGVHPYSKSEFFRRPLPAEALRALVDHLATGRVRGQSRELDCSPWAGAYNRVPPDATAFVHRAERFLLKQAANVAPDVPDDELQAARRWLADSWALAHPWGSGGVYQNFPDPDLEDWEHAYYGANLDRLRRVKRRYDPEGFFRPPQSITG